jgi:hypothetical protein
MSSNWKRKLVIFLNGHFSEWNKPDFDYLDSIPCRSKVNRRAEMLQKKQQTSVLVWESNRMNGFPQTKLAAWILVLMFKHYRSEVLPSSETNKL